MNKAAQALGRLARGVQKNYSAAEIERRSKILAGINARKRAKAKKRRMPNIRIIAAAPELLAALGSLLSCCIPTGQDTRTDRAMQQAQKAITKAT